MHPARLPIDELLKQCVIRSDRRSGPGGQHRNKVQTAVVITHQPTGIVGEASERRSQAANRSEAIFRLRLNLAVQHRERQLATPPGPSPLWVSRMHGDKLIIAADHSDFPSLLAECLQMLEHAQFDMPQAAAVLRVTPSQLIKLLRKHPSALIAVNQNRQRLGLRSLK
jgi:hypothetical protein